MEGRAGVLGARSELNSRVQNVDYARSLLGRRVKVGVVPLGSDNLVLLTLACATTTFSIIPTRLAVLLCALRALGRRRFLRGSLALARATTLRRGGLFLRGLVVGRFLCSSCELLGWRFGVLRRVVVGTLILRVRPSLGGLLFGSSLCRSSEFLGLSFSLGGFGVRLILLGRFRGGLVGPVVLILVRGLLALAVLESRRGSFLLSFRRSLASLNADQLARLLDGRVLRASGAEGLAEAETRAMG